MSLFDKEAIAWVNLNDKINQLPSPESTSTKYNRRASSFFTTDYNSTNTENLKRRNFISFTAYFTLGYYFGVIPFRPQYDPDSDCWKLKTSWFQQSVCMLGLWTPYWIYYATNAPGVFGSFYYMKQLTARSYFIFLRNFINYGKIITFFWIINTSTKKLEIIINNMSGNDLLFPCKNDTSERARQCRSAKNKGLLYLIFLAFVCISVSITNFIFVQYPGAPVMSPYQLFPKFITNCRRRFFLDLKSANFSSISAGYTNEELALGTVEIILRFYNYLIFMMMESFFLGALPVTFWIATSNFHSYISSIEKRYFNLIPAEGDAYKVRQTIRENYEKMKEFSTGLNEVWSTVNLNWIVDNSMRIIFLLNDAVSTRNALNWVTIFFLVLFWAGTMIFSAEVYRKMHVFKTWLLDRKTRQKFYTRDSNELKFLIQEVENEAVGIGSDGLYKFDYPFNAQFFPSSCLLLLLHYFL